jgi:Uma2 family endonuclease
MIVKTAAKPQPVEPVSPLTGDELFAMGDIGRSELVKGELILISPTGHPHGYYEGNFFVALHTFVRPKKLGRVLVGEVGIYTTRNPDTVRGADVVFISNERMAQVQSASYLDVAPELVVEILSPDDRWSEIQDKLAEYFNIGVQMVWVANPKQQQVYVYRSLTEMEIVDADELLTGDDLLLGFSVSVAELFE